MLMKVRRASFSISKTIEVIETNTIEDLIALSDKYNKEDIIICRGTLYGDKEDEISLLIYDDYLE